MSQDVRRKQDRQRGFQGIVMQLESLKDRYQDLVPDKTSAGWAMANELPDIFDRLADVIRAQASGEDLAPAIACLFGPLSRQDDFNIDIADLEPAHGYMHASTETFCILMTLKQGHIQRLRETAAACPVLERQSINGNVEIYLDMVNLAIDCCFPALKTINDYGNALWRRQNQINGNNGPKLQ